MELNSGVKIAFIKHHSKDYTYVQIRNMFNEYFGKNGNEALNFIDDYIIYNVFKDAFKISINIWTGTNEYFYVTIKNEDGLELSKLRIVCKYSNFYVECIGEKQEESKIKSQYEKYIKDSFDNLCKIAKLSKSNTVKVNLFKNSKVSDTIELKGSIEEIFDEFTNLNDKLKYINSKFYRFDDENVEKAYKYYVSVIDKNHFLNNAVKHNKLID